MRLEPEAIHVLAILDAEPAVWEVGAAYALDGRGDPRMAKRVGNLSADREALLHLRHKLDALGIVGLAPAVEDRIVGRRERQRGDAGATAGWEDILKQPVRGASVLGRAAGTAGCC